jgi:hypothetical protein
MRQLGCAAHTNPIWITIAPAPRRFSRPHVCAAQQWISAGVRGTLGEVAFLSLRLVQSHWLEHLATLYER